MKGRNPSAVPALKVIAQLSSGVTKQRLKSIRRESSSGRMKHNYPLWYLDRNVSFNLSDFGLGFLTTCVSVVLSQRLDSPTGCTKCFFIVKKWEMWKPLEDVSVWIYEISVCFIHKKQTERRNRNSFRTGLMWTLIPAKCWYETLPESLKLWICSGHETETIVGDALKD